MDLKTILREGLIFSDYERVLKFLEEYKIEEVLQHYIDENNKDVEDLESQISDLEDEVRDHESDIELLGKRFDKIEELLDEELTKEQLVEKIKEIIND